MKRLVILSLLLFNVIFTSHAQLELRHLIRPGETPTSIAAKYGVSVQDLINSNGELGKFYTGATIVVPVIKSPAKNELVSSTKSTSHSHTSYQTSSNQNEASNAGIQSNSLLRAGLEQMKVYNYSKAKRLFTQYLKIKEIPEVYYYRGLCSYKQSKWKAASDDFWIASRKAADEDDFKADAEELYELANAKHEEIVERRRETWAEIGRTVGEALLVTTAVVADAYLQTQYGVSTMPYSYSTSTYGTSFASVPTYSGVASMSDTQFNQYINSELTSLMAVTMQQVEQQQAAEYMNFATYNKKPDGTDYTREEYNMMKGQALYEMKMQDTGSTSTYQSEHDESNGSGIKRGPRVQENIDYWKETYGDKECKFCRGTGKCANCNGKGVCSAGFGLGEMACPNCLHGHPGKCSHCQGDGIVYGHKGI